MILAKLGKLYTGTTLARIAVEVGEEEDIRLLLQEWAETMTMREDEDGETAILRILQNQHLRINWSETVGGEDCAILWALKNDKYEIVEHLVPHCNINLEGDPSADLTINCGSETFKVHSIFLRSKSPVFSAMLNSDMREAREGKINIKDMNSNTISAMINYFYKREVADGWKDLDIVDVAKAADMHDLQGWMDLFCSELECWVTDEVPAGKVADMIIAGSRYEHTLARDLIRVARRKISEKREITKNKNFREKLRREDPMFLLRFCSF